jgi:hypothetical protein
MSAYTAPSMSCRDVFFLFMVPFPFPFSYSNPLYLFTVSYSCAADPVRPSAAAELLSMRKGACMYPVLIMDDCASHVDRYAAQFAVLVAV